MTYEEIFRLKFKEEVPTYELGRRFPKELKKISKIALMELSPSALKLLMKRERELKELLSLKRNLLKKVRQEGN